MILPFKSAHNIPKFYDNKHNSLHSNLKVYMPGYLTWSLTQCLHFHSKWRLSFIYMLTGSQVSSKLERSLLQSRHRMSTKSKTMTIVTEINIISVVLKCKKVNYCTDRKANCGMVLGLLISIIMWLVPCQSDVNGSSRTSVSF